MDEKTRNELLKKVLTSFLQGIGQRLGSELAGGVVGAVEKRAQQAQQRTSVPVSYLGTVFTDQWGGRWFRNIGQVWFNLQQPGVPVYPPPMVTPMTHIYMDQSGMWYAQTASGWFIYSAPAGWTLLH